MSRKKQGVSKQSGRQKCSSPGCCSGINRRDFIKALGAGAMVALGPGMPAMAGPFQVADFDKLVPADKKLSAQWIASLYARGSRAIYSGKDLQFIGMPVGGICSGQVYLGGDGKLWWWDIFNHTKSTGAGNYAKPPEQSSPFDQGFALRITSAGKSQVRALDRTGFADVSFCGEYPIGYVEYRDPASPVGVSLEAFSPFVPLNADESSLPATVLRFAVKNTGAAAVDVELAGWLENAVCVFSGKSAAGTRKNRITRGDRLLMLECSAEAAPQTQATREPIVFADFEGQDFGAWKVEGTAFGKGPGRKPGHDQHLSGFMGKGLANSYIGGDADHPVGKLTSPAFTIERPWISFLIGGGNHPKQTCINLIVDGKVVKSETGKNTDAMEWANWDVRGLAGKSAVIEIVDDHKGGWGHIDIDQIEFRDTPRNTADRLPEEADYGTLALALLDAQESDLASEALPEAQRPASIFAEKGLASDGANARPLGQKLAGALGRKVTLEPGQQTLITFAITWHFGNLRLKDGGRYYTNRFASAGAVAQYLGAHVTDLWNTTRLWHDTWYDSTLPYWFLDRTFGNTSILASSTSHWFKNGRFYGWEGVGCCAGTCTHVWHYAHAVGRIFPQLERILRERVDFGSALNKENGIIQFRGESNGLAIDGQSGCILRALREHQMSPDDAFLKRNWPGIKRALECLIEQDGDNNGIIEGSQHNTLDANWFGPVAWLSGLYLAALRAGEEMAKDVGDEEFAKRTRAIFDVGTRKIVELLFDGEYFINKPDPKHLDAINSGTGCEIDQVFGQSWAFQVALGRVLPEKETRSALQALWKYNFSPDVGPYRQINKAGRWYAMAGEAGLLMCTFPRSDWDFKKAAGNRANPGFAGYFNECMNGFEHQVAGHMIWEGMVEQGLAIIRAVHDRYHASRRNPWNEVECGDHYARSMASYGVFVAACGYEYHGPHGYMAFAPRLSPENFRAAFTVAEGWGTFSQQSAANSFKAAIELKSGKVRLRTLAFTLHDQLKAQKVVVTVGGQEIAAQHTIAGNRLTINLAADALISAGSKIELSVA